MPLFDGVPLDGVLFHDGVLLDGVLVDAGVLIAGKLSKLSVKDSALLFSGLGVLGVPVDLTLEFIKSLVLEGVGVDLEDFLWIGDGVYAAFKALSVPILIPSFDVAKRCAAGLSVEARIVMLFGVLMWVRAADMALPFLSL